MDFQSSYNRNEFLKFLRNDFLWEKFEEHVEQTSIIKEFKSSFFTSITKLWVVEEFDNLIVLEIEHKSKNDARISLTKDIFKLLREFELEWLVRQNALVILKNPDTQQYRFSLLTTTYNEDFEEKLSNPKRYSFLLGKWEKTKTPTEYLINKWKVDSFETLISRFDVEVVRKEFFNDYLTLYIRLYKAIIDDKEFVSLLKTQKIELVSFTKNLLWKIVFLYFIQKKWWLWVEVDKQYWVDWDKNFMRSFWDNFKSDKKTVWENTGFFYNDYLEHLFYEWLNKDNRDDNDLSDYFDFKVPYLNGWLFKKDYEKWNKNESKIINDIFSNKTDSFEWDGILDIFDTYNFTIDEDDLYDSDIAIDPEMLGRIFEKMISISEDNIDEIIKIYDKKWKLEIGKELNKKFGAFYTPREIVHYMTKESIISYLVNNLKWNKEDKLKREQKEAKIRTLFELKEKFLITKSEITEEIFEELADIIEDIDDLLKKVKILDPAIGSGAFPMWILHEVSSIRYYIYWVFYNTFWMNSSEFLIPHPNTLLRGEGKKVVSMYKIKRDIIKNNIFWVDISAWAIDIAKLRFWLSLVVEEETPEPLPNFEFKFVCANTLIPLAEEEWQAHLEFEKELKVETLRKYMGQYYNADSNKDKEEYKALISKYLWFWKNITMDFWTKSERTKQLETYEPFNPNHSTEFFDPSLMMGNTKFDIVIGNPPYIWEKWNSWIFKLYKSNINWKDFTKKRANLYYLFLIYWLKILKNDWVITYIIPNDLLTSDYSSHIRTNLYNNSYFKLIFDFNNNEVFEWVWTKAMIIAYWKKLLNNWKVNFRKYKNFKWFRKNILLEKYDTNDVKNSDLDSKYWNFTNNDLEFDNVNIEYYWLTTQVWIQTWCNDISWKVFNKVVKYYPEFESSYWLWIYVLKYWIDFKKSWESYYINNSIDKKNKKWKLLSELELEFIKPIYTWNIIWKWNVKPNDKYVIWLNKENYNSDILLDIPNIIKHLDNYKIFLINRNAKDFIDLNIFDNTFDKWKLYNRDWDTQSTLWKWNYYLLQKYAYWLNFEDSKIAWQSRWNINFYYSKNIFYWLSSINFIYSKLIPEYLNKFSKEEILLLINWILNSSLLKKYYEWNNNTWTKIKNIPIIKINQDNLKQLKICFSIINNVKKLLESWLNKDILENEIDEMVYELYGLTKEEIDLVEESLKK